MTNNNNNQSHVSRPILFFSVVLAILFAYCAQSSLELKITSSEIYVRILLFLPFLPFILVLFDRNSETHSLHSGIAFFSAFSIFSFLVCWCIYINEYDVTRKWVSVIPIVFIFLLFGFTILITRAIFRSTAMNVQNTSKLDKICNINTISKFPFLTLCMFLVMFISITYLFGFAFSFNDRFLKQNGEIGLFIDPDSKPRIEKIADSKVTNIYIISEENKDIYTKLKEVFKEKDKQAEFIKFIFNENKFKHQKISENQLITVFSEINHSKVDRDNKQELDKLAKILTIAISPFESFNSYNTLKDNLRFFFKDQKNKKIIDLILKMYLRNNNNFSYIIKFKEYTRNNNEYSGITFDTSENSNFSMLKKQLKKLYSDEKIEITLKGYSSKTTMNKGDKEFRTNQELSAKRIFSVENKLDTYFREDLNFSSNSISWKRYPLGSEDNGSSLETPSVEVSIEVLPSSHELNLFAKKTQQLTLLEYMYFSIYTITTTGYGDIFPVSHEAKLFSALGNLLEMYFIVIFFNIFLSESINKINKQTLALPLIVNSHSNTDKD